MQTAKRWHFIVAIVVIDILLLWCAGFVWYVADVQARHPLSAQALAAMATPETTAIVALTGGSDRIAAAVKLLQEGAGKQLFISGAGTDIKRLLAAIPHDLALERCCIALGHQAEDTMGNATETAAWLQQQPYRGIILVTAHYHMARSLLVFQNRLPSTINITPYPVAPVHLSLAGWWYNAGTARLLISEYTKLLATFLRHAWKTL
jgi:uncharacterized SAM-binding protein YcdF (DUF218 family)